MLLSEYEELKKNMNKLAMKYVNKQQEMINLKKEMEKIMKECLDIKNTIDNAEEIKIDTFTHNQ